MTSTEERIDEIRRSAIPERLLRGAAVLGNLWRSGSRCVGGWSALCPCEEGKESSFCLAKEKWVGLCRDWSPDGLEELHEADPHFVLKVMTVRMFEATQLTMTVSLQGAEKSIKIGPKSTSFSTLISLFVAVTFGAPLVESWNVVASTVEGLS